MSTLANANAAALSGTMFPENTIVVTNRALCARPFLEQVQRVCAMRPAMLVLREKDLNEPAYRTLAADVQFICRNAGVPFVVHSHQSIARDLNADGLHLPLPLARDLGKEALSGFSSLGLSVHSAAEAREACSFGATYLMTGHIYETDCKPGLPPRGLRMLSKVCAAAGSVPVYAVGGINLDPERIAAVRAVGAVGSCTMSAAMAIRQ